MTKKANLHEALKKYFGFDKFKGDQEKIIQNVLDGKDTFVLMPTGGGKSLCYQLPSLLMDGVAIVISPLIALMKNQVDIISQLSEHEGTAHYLNSSLNKAAIDQVKADIQAGITKLLYVAPESLTKEENVEFLKSVKISFYAVDEAHCISEWGHDFRPEYRRIRPIVNEIGPAPIIALTATATDKVRSDIKKNLGIMDAKEFKSSFNRPNLYYEVRPKTKDVDKDIIRFIKQHPGKSGIIYCLSRKKVEELAAILRANDIKAAAYHAGLDSSTRTQTQDDFLMENIDVIVATIAFGMGIDKPDVRFVIHYDIPKSLEGYYQETGRAGRDGGEGICLAFYSRKDLDKLEKFMEGKPVAEQDIGRQLLVETAAYAETSVCRRKMLLHYFGETYDRENCGNCDNCLHPKTKIEAMNQLVTVLQVIQRIKENFRSFMIVKDAEFSDEIDGGSEHEGTAGALDPTLASMLRDLRKKVSKRMERPPYVIFQDVSIDQMATDYPVTLEELKNIQGVGEGKVKQPYAKEFVDLIKKYCAENEIERQADLRVRTVAKKSMLKVKIIQSIDRQIALDDIANAQGIDFDELLSEIEAIVYSGTKLNIDYFLDEVMDEDHVDDIYDYFAESDTDRLSVAQDELGGDYSEDEIRLVRIKFLSEMAN